MSHSLGRLARSAFAATSILVFATGCAIAPKQVSRTTHDRTFIAYWPPSKDSNQIKLAIKDNIDMQGVVTTAGSEHFYNLAKPARRDAECLEIARERNVHFVGKVNLSEFAVAPSGINDFFGTPRNPFNGWRKLIPGGSSCGSAYAVASGKADIAFGTDTAGSVRVPAACCGVVGLKTTHGLVSLEGVFPVEPDHLDTVGPLARDVSGVVLGMDLLERGFMRKYNAAVAATPTPQTIRVGRLRLKGTDRRIDRAIDQALIRSGFEIVELDADFRAKWEQAHKDGTAVAAAGAWISGKNYVGKLGVSARTKSIIAVGAVAYRTQYRKALSRRDDWQRALRDVFQKVDLIALPTLQTLPPPMPPTLKVDLIKAKAQISALENTDPLRLALHPIETLTSIPATGLRLLGIDLLEADMLKLQNTVAVNFAGNPAIAVPIPLRKGRKPLTSLQLVGPRYSEAKLLAAARFVELED